MCSNQEAWSAPESTFRMGTESLETEARQAAGRQGASGCKVQGQSAGQVMGDPSGKECWKVVHDATTIWHRVSVEELVKSLLRGNRCV